MWHSPVARLSKQIVAGPYHELSTTWQELMNVTTNVGTLNNMPIPRRVMVTQKASRGTVPLYWVTIKVQQCTCQHYKQTTMYVIKNSNLYVIAIYTWHTIENKPLIYTQPSCNTHICSKIEQCWMKSIQSHPFLGSIQKTPFQ